MFFKMEINVGLINPVKVEAVRRVFNLFFDNVNIKGVKINSEADAQSKNLKEIMNGARDRAINCFHECKCGVGLESGIFPMVGSLSGYLNTSGCAIYDGSEILGVGLSPAFEYPKSIINKILQKKFEVNQIAAEIFACENIGQKQGAIGVLTRNQCPRTNYSKAAVMMALFPILNKKIYNQK